MNNPNTSNDRDLSHHILPNSSTMVGVCVMVISIVKSFKPSLASFWIDEILAVDSVLFMVSALLSFFSIRAKQTADNWERWAEIVFLLGLVSMTIATVLFTFEIA